MLNGLKNLLVLEVQVPLNKIAAVIAGQPSMYSNMILEMTKERFQCIGCFRDSWVVQVMEHVG